MLNLFLLIFLPFLVIGDPYITSDPAPLQCDFDDAFVCNDGRCILPERQCDNVPDCDNCEDEINCNYKHKCIPGQFMCKSGECLPPEMRCDGNKNCLDGSDENGCNENEITSTSNTPISAVETNRIPLSEALCDPYDELQCDNGKCLPIERKCDNIIDCDNGEDEYDCLYLHYCQPGLFMCHTGECLSPNVRCNEKRECMDGSDEYGCKNMSVSLELPSDPTIIRRRFLALACDLESEYQCDNTKCITKEHRCDNIPDCDNGEDEFNCDYIHECEPGLFICKSGECLPPENRCDGKPNCLDGSDENGCEPAVGLFRNRFKQPPLCDPQEEFQCLNGTCIPIEHHCDNVVDCANGEDEESCHYLHLCKPGLFMCRSGECLPSNERCNGKRNCLDGSDEFGCPIDSRFSNSFKNLLPFPCHSGDYKCGEEEKCIPKESVCDNIPDCANGEDEKSCDYFNNKPSSCKIHDEFKCRNGTCLPIARRCDNIPDCRRGEDERGCQYLHRCKPGLFMCHSGECLTPNLRCNGNSDCFDGSDEYGCPKKEFSEINDLFPNYKIPFLCDLDQFVCNNGTCLDIGHRCDKILHCSEGEDEKDCRSHDLKNISKDKCEPLFKLCNNDDDDNGKCQRCAILCNGTLCENCSEGYDEIKCSENLYFVLNKDARTSSESRDNLISQNYDFKSPRAWPYQPNPISNKVITSPPSEEMPQTIQILEKCSNPYNSINILLLTCFNIFLFACLIAEIFVIILMLRYFWNQHPQIRYRLNYLKTWIADRLKLYSPFETNSELGIFFITKKEKITEKQNVLDMNFNFIGYEIKINIKKKSSPTNSNLS